MTFRESVLGASQLLVAPGVAGPLFARIVETAGFEAVYMSGAYSTMNILGLPDAELLGLDEMVGNGRRISDVVTIPVIADADTGFGNAMNARRTVSSYIKAGISALHFEDQESPKRCGHLAGKSLVPDQLFVQKLIAANDARGDSDFMLIARSDARDVEGMDGLLRRVEAYSQTGVDMVFAEGVKSVEEVRAVHEACGLPLLVNQVPNGSSPVLPHEELFAAGARIAIYPSNIMAAAILGAESAADSLRKQTFDSETIPSPREVFERVGISDWLATEQKYASDS